MQGWSGNGLTSSKGKGRVKGRTAGRERESMGNRGAQGSLAEIPQFHPRVQSLILDINPGT